MATAALVSSHIDSGFDLLAVLRKSLDVRAAAWLLSAEEGVWRLFVVVGTYPGGDKLRGYRLVLDALRDSSANIEPDGLRPTRSAAIDPDDIRLVRVDQPIGQWLTGWQSTSRGVGMIRTRGICGLGDLGFIQSHIYPPPGPLPPDQVVRIVAEYLQRTADRPATFEMGETARQLEPIGIRREVDTRRLVVEAHNPLTGQTESIPADEITGIEVPRPITSR